MSPSISVIMGVYNGEKYLREAIESILKQTFTDFEFLIIDDGSTDKSHEIILSYNDPRIRLIANEQNIGLTKSLNRGLSQAKSEYVARMDADDISHSERLAQQTEYMKFHPDVVVLGTNSCAINDDGKPIWRTFLLADPSFDDFLKENRCVHGTILFRKEIINNIGGYNELFLQGQDYALWLEISKKYRIHNLPQILYYLRIHNSSLSIKQCEKTMFFDILAKRLASGTDIKDLLNLYTECFRTDQYLDPNERIFYYNYMAGVYMMQKNLKAARKQ
jgi:glycosyltransferase involved in cell wall biosynthesis